MEKQTPKDKANKLDELNVDLENYIANTIIPQLYVDDNLILRKFTLPAIDQFNLTTDDINKNIQEVSDKINYPALVEDVKEVIKTGNNLEKEIQTLGDRWFQMNILPYVFKKEKRTNGVMITLIDISKRIAIVNELKQLNAEHSTLLHKLSHNLKQPISNITLLADELTDAYEQKDTELFTTWVEILRAASDKMNTLVEDFTNHLLEE